MALIKCPKCNHDVSDTAKTCPNCGYRLKNKKNITYKETNVYLKWLGFIAIILATITSLFGPCVEQYNYYRDSGSVYVSNTYVGIYEMIDLNYSLIVWLMLIIAIISILFVIIHLIKKHKIKILNKFNKNKLICYIPTFIYTIAIAIVFIMTICASFNNRSPQIKTEITSIWTYTASWGEIWVLILLLFASLVFILDIVKSSKAKK